MSSGGAPRESIAKTNWIERQPLTANAKAAARGSWQSAHDGRLSLRGLRPAPGLNPPCPERLISLNSLSFIAVLSTIQDHRVFNALQFPKALKADTPLRILVSLQMQGGRRSRIDSSATSTLPARCLEMQN